MGFSLFYIRTYEGLRTRTLGGQQDSHQGIPLE